MIEVLDGLTPADLGLDPSEFPEFRRDGRTGREVQLEVLEAAAYCEKRFAVLSAPTGIGKSLVAVSLQKLMNLRTVVLTGTKALQAQYVEKFGRAGLVEVKGRANYECLDFGGWDCRGGAMLGCRLLRGRGCAYEQARGKAREGSLVVANYAYWMTVNDKAGGLERTGELAEVYGANPVEMLVMDEADQAPRWLEDYLAVRVYEKEVARWADGKTLGEEWEVWRGLAGLATAELEADVKVKSAEVVGKGRGVKREEVEELHRLQRLQAKMQRIAGAKEEEWVIERREGTRWGRMWCFDVVWPGRYAEQYLFCGVPKVVMMSATVRPKTLGLLGVKKEEAEFREWERVFPGNRHPIYLCPAKTDEGKEVRVDRRTGEEDLRRWVDHIDRIVDGRLDRKGIVQTVSYQRQRYLFEHSRHRDIFLGNTDDPESDTAVEVAEEFRKKEPPCVLVSPSFAVGWDFPGVECEYVVICKVPFKPSQGKVGRVREERDPSYSAYLTMQEMVQGAGRGMRSEGDRCEVFVLDGHLGWFLGKFGGLGPDWFRRAVRKVGEIPKAAEKL